jgi:type IV secretory pathway VirB4 component
MLIKAIELSREVSGMEADIKKINGEYLELDDFEYSPEEIIKQVEQEFL